MLKHQRYVSNLSDINTDFEQILSYYFSVQALNLNTYCQPGIVEKISGKYQVT